MTASDEKQTNSPKSQRILWIDCAKGFGLLLVILAHTLAYSVDDKNIWRGIFFSFHMPLFFILSAATFQFSADISQFKHKTLKAFQHLILPALVLFGLQVLCDTTIFRGGVNRFFWQQEALTLFYFSGIKALTFDHVIEPIGALWFFMVLFIGRSLFDFMQVKFTQKYLLIYCAVLASCLGICCGYFSVYLPFSFDVALAVLPFFLLRQNFKNLVEKSSLFHFIGFVLLWLGTFVFTFEISSNYLELAARQYPLFPLCYLTAFCGVTAFCQLCRAVSERAPDWCRFIFYLGRNSIFLYGVHALDENYKWLWNHTGNTLYDAGIRIAIDVVICILIVEGYQFLRQCKVWQKF